MNKSTLKIGKGAINNVEWLLNKEKITGTAMLFTGHTSGAKYAHIVERQISKVMNFKHEYITENSISNALNIAAHLIETDATCVIGLGGGRVLDVCKYSARIANIPYIAIASTLSNDGVASPIAVLTQKNGKPKSLGCRMPDSILIDTDIILDSPKKLIAAGIGDAISNYMALKDWDYACDCGEDEKIDFAYLMSQNAVDTLLLNCHQGISSDFIRVLANSHVLSGIAMKYAGSSRPVSGSEHLFSHALDYYTNHNNLHGIQVALGTVAILKLMDFPYDIVVRYLETLSVSINPLSMSITEDEFIFCMQNASAMRPNRYTYLNVANLETSNLKRLYRNLVQELY